MEMMRRIRHRLERLQLYPALFIFNERRYDVRQVRSEKELQTLRQMYEAYIRPRNLAPLRTDHDWVYRGNGEVGQPDWFSRGKQSYTYIFSDETGDHAYLKFVFDFLTAIDPVTLSPLLTFKSFLV